jgi:Dolichyl-phosphate-mannose-protein mannosyltransferase
MLLTTPWVVHFNFQKSFAKPPLQYWLTTLPLPRFENRTFAVRIWPLLCGVLTAITVALLARVLAPDRPWLAPLSVAILVSSPLFAAEAGRALLDIGLAFFTTFAIFRGNLRFPVAKLTVDELRGAPPPPPILGVCVARDFPLVQAVYSKVQMQFTRAQFILWRVDAE